jgi:hypothetical protein
MQERLASLNMNSPIYTSSFPDSVCSTPKTLLLNVIQSMKELMESRLARMVLQLLRTEGGNSGVMVHLLSPSRNSIKICTVVTRFEARPESSSVEESEGELVIRMMFKAVLDVTIFGEMTTGEMQSPVSIVGEFHDVESEGPLLSSVDIKFDCTAFLREMIRHARTLVKKAVMEAAALSVKILSISENAAGETASLGAVAPFGNVGNQVAGLGNSDNARLLAAAQGLGLANSNSAGLLAAALKGGGQHGPSSVEGNQGTGYAPASDAGMLPAALKLGAQQTASIILK